MNNLIIIDGFDEHGLFLNKETKVLIGLVKKVEHNN
jgi:hypothetical protein